MRQAFHFIACMLRLALMAFAVALPAQGFAVSLGDELILSRLGDPVEVEIEVLQWEDMDLDRVQISAATREEYEVFNLTWLPVLEDLDFNLVGPDLDGDVRVLISSRDPLNEPFLELLLVLRWPGGSLRREYVLLFDPPGVQLTGTAPATSADAAPAVVMTVPQLPPAAEPEPVVDTAEPQLVALVAEPVAQIPSVNEAAPLVTPVQEPAPVLPQSDASDEAVAETQEPAAPSAEADFAETVTPAANVEASDSEIPDARTQVAIDVDTLAPQTSPAPLDTTRRTYQVRSGDSLWNIARQFLPAGTGDNIYQMLLGIHDLNRGSFINGNISLLKANALLQVPTDEDINAVDAATAEAEFDRRWQEGTQRFDAVQRGEAIPLFAPPPEEPAVTVEEDLPPGIEAPPAESGENDLILASNTNVPALPLVSDAEQRESVDVTTADNAPMPDRTEPVQDQPVQQTGDAADTTTDAAATVPVAGVSRATITAELETEVAAMRARRESAEALAQRLQASLRQAQAERAAQASPFSSQNMMLAVSALGLLVALIAGVVISMKIAADPRLRRNGTAASTPGDGAQPAWLESASITGDKLDERREPHMPDMADVAMVEPVAPVVQQSAPTAERRSTEDPDDLFSRMDDILGSAANLPKK